MRIRPHLSRFFVISAVIGVTTLGCGDTPSATVPERKVAVQVAPLAPAASQKKVADGKQALAEGRPEDAVARFTEVLKSYRQQQDKGSDALPEVVALYQRGLAYLAMGFPDTAAEDFSAALRLRSDHGPAYAGRAEAYAALGDWYKATRDATTAIRFEPRQAAGYRWRANAYMQRGRNDRAALDFEQAVKLDPALAEVLRPQMALAYYRWSEALESSDRALEAAEKLAAARRLDPDVGQDFEAASPAPVEPAPAPVVRLAAKPVIPEAVEHFEKGSELLRDRQLEQALIEFTEAIALDRAYFDAYLKRGETLIELKFPDTALRDLQQAAELEDTSAEAHRLQARAFGDLDLHFRTVSSATEALHLDPTHAETYAIRGKGYAAMEQWDRAVHDLEAAIRLDPALDGELRPILEHVRQANEAAVHEQSPTPRAAPAV